MNYEQIAAEVGLHRTYVSKIVRGRPMNWLGVLSQSSQWLFPRLGLAHWLTGSLAPPYRSQ
jgi:hypothetical protein